MAKIKKRKSVSPLVLPLVIVGILILTGGAFASYWWVFRGKHMGNSAANIETEVGQNNPAKTGNSSDKGQVATPTQSDTRQIQNASPFVNYFGRTGLKLEVDAYIPSISEDGTCTLTVKDGAGAVIYTASGPAHADVQSTRCENFVFNDSGANSSWTATVLFKSSQYTGSSEPTKFN